MQNLAAGVHDESGVMEFRLQFMFDITPCPALRLARDFTPESEWKAIEPDSAALYSSSTADRRAVISKFKN